MPVEKVIQRIGATNLDIMSKRELIALLNSTIDALRAVTVKLDADATVTDTNYTAVVDAIVSK